MHFVLIAAHPVLEGFAHRIIHAFIEGLDQSKHTYDIIDLYREPVQQNFLTFEAGKPWTKDADKRVHYQERLEKADQLLIAHPLWWGGQPAILKNFLDNNLTPGFAYKYTKKPWWLPSFLNLKPRGLFQKKVHIYITCDAPVWLYSLLFFPFFSIWYFFVLNFCGMKLGSLHLYGRMRWKSEQKRTRILNKVQEKAKYL